MTTMKRKMFSRRRTRRVTLTIVSGLAVLATAFMLVSVGTGDTQIGALAQYQEQLPGKGCGDKNHEHTGGAPPSHSNGQGQGNQGKDPDETDCKKPPK